MLRLNGDNMAGSFARAGNPQKREVVRLRRAGSEDNFMGSCVDQPRDMLLRLFNPAPGLVAKAMRVAVRIADTSPIATHHDRLDPWIKRG